MIDGILGTRPDKDSAKRIDHQMIKTACKGTQKYEGNKEMRGQPLQNKKKYYLCVFSPLQNYGTGNGICF